ncbi:hypothetical protein CONCODRAFT_115566 [Conidiobolus coronatus NRRL 28638]|uniref:RGS domain-containing protein n=1 Tax=Conidiobolus coronatus (strain ATCC 28846 / CBS 209.66 / NRRL 28638) TaxID=796925 RepID=A0A137NXV4_CONC2|nr:hypothetical protein CONCODRAFT_115566 [Conidiobolus coronatus NRRL 28638]|eukprot:KXN67508.1 hypothetical protein CONCODRAFT_115566 [Conidiobolus coronatus NRRL 28638]
MHTFFSSDSNLELNLPYSITSKLFKNLKKSTEPGVFLETYEHIYNTLNYNSFPKFIKFNEKKLTNINQLFNILLIVILAVLIITVYTILFIFRANRWIRLICFPLWFLFFASILCAIYSVFNLANILGLFKSRVKSGEGNWVRQSIMSSNTFLKQRPQSMNKKEEDMTSFWSQSFLNNHQQKNMSSSKLLDPIRASLMPGGREQIKAISYLKLVKNRIVILSLIASLTCTIPFLIFPF